MPNGMTVTTFLNNLEARGYWDEFCDNCLEETPHPEGFCTVCGEELEEDDE